MPLLTKGQVRTAVKQAIDDPTNKRWSDANLDILIGMVQDTIYQAVLDTFEWYNFGTATGTTSAAGALVNMNSIFGSRPHRLLKVMRTSDLFELQPKLRNERVPQLAYDWSGDTLYTDPPLNAVNLTLQASFLPDPFYGLATDATTIQFFPNHEASLIYVSASWALVKGGAESLAQVGRIADVAVDALLTHFSRLWPVATTQRLQSVKSAIMRQSLEAPGAEK